MAYLLSLMKNVGEFSGKKSKLNGLLVKKKKKKHTKRKQKAGKPEN